MKTKIKSPLGKLSFLENVHIELEMTGGHHDMLMTSDPDFAERTVVSILDDLMDEDAYSLTLTEVYYLFSLVKANSLGNSLVSKWTCNRIVMKGDTKSVCQSVNEFKFSISEADLKALPDGYEPKELDLKLSEDKTVRVKLIIPKIETELEVIDYFLNQGKSKKDIVSDKKTANEYMKLRLVSSFHCISEPIGNNQSSREMYLKALKENHSYKEIHQLMLDLKELNSYGIDRTPREVICEECGGKLSFHLPLLAGLSL